MYFTVLLRIRNIRRSRYTGSRLFSYLCPWSTVTLIGLKKYTKNFISIDHSMARSGSLRSFASERFSFAAGRSGRFSTSRPHWWGITGKTTITGKKPGSGFTVPQFLNPNDSDFKGPTERTHTRSSGTCTFVHGELHFVIRLPLLISLRTNRKLLQLSGRKRLQWNRLWGKNDYFWISLGYQFRDI